MQQICDHVLLFYPTFWLDPQSADRTLMPHLLEEKTISRSATSYLQPPPLSKLPEHAIENHQGALLDHLLVRDYSWEVQDHSHLGLL